MLAIWSAWALAGVVIVVGGSPIVPLAASAAVFLQVLGRRALVILLVGATFVTRVRIDVLGTSFRIEHFVLLACLLALLAAGRAGALAAAVRDRTAVLIALFVAWNGAVSILRAPQQQESLLIVGWLALDWLILVVVVAAGEEPEKLARQGTVWAGAAAVIGVGLWALVAAGVDHRVGVQDVTDRPAVAAYGLSYEANIFGSALALWAFVALTGVRSLAPRLRAAIVAVCVAGIMVSFTRAALVGLGAGLLVWAVIAGHGARRTVVPTVVGTVLATLVAFSLIPGPAAPIRTEVSELVEFGSGTGVYRVDTWRTALGDLQGANWVLGLGTNSYGQRHLEPTRPDVPIPAYLGNLPLQVLYDSGILGFALLAAALFTAMPRKRRAAARGAGLVVVYLVCATATSPLWFGSTWVLLAIAVLARRRAEGTSAEGTSAEGTSAEGTM